MKPDDSISDMVDPQRLRDVLAIVHEQVATALWLSAGIVAAVAGSVCIAFGWRKAALVLAFLYGLTLCFVHNGHAQLLGPLDCAISLTGFLWPTHRTR
jgi:hypothetical protein